jgi:hypothetical protein
MVAIEPLAGEKPEALITGRLIPSLSSAKQTFQVGATISVSIPKKVDSGSGQGRRSFESTDAVRLRRGYQNGENAGPERKIPFLE